MQHRFHLVDKSLWPFIISINLFCFLSSIVLTCNFYIKGVTIFYLSLFSTTLVFYLWTRDTVRESEYSGFHNKYVIIGLLGGIILFIASETMVFIGVFWGYLHNYFYPSIEIGSKWPSKHVESLDPFEIPLINTVLLLSAATSVTVTHHSVTAWENNKSYSYYIVGCASLFVSILLVIVFLYLQYVEFYSCSFDLSDSIFASVFFCGTTLHGLHVLVAAIWLSVTFYRLFLSQQWNLHHTNLLTSLWYFHFTDVVWLVLYTLYYLLTF